jgi:GNAT superfamily N-acetyltransferase
MLTLTDLRPGDIGFSNITGYAGALVWLGQRLLAATEPSEYTIKHAYMVTEALSDTGGHGPWIVQAMPHGAEEIEIGQEHWTRDFVYVRPDYQRWQNPSSLANLAYKQAETGFWVAEAARKYIGTPYSFLDYAAILGLHMGVKNGRVRRYVTTSKHMICSQLVDQVLSDAGLHVFDDGRLPQDVMPIELYRALLLTPGTKMMRPGYEKWQPGWR